MAKTIFLDPGHGGRDPGAVNGTRLEKNDNLRLANAVRRNLQKQGFTVIMSRESDIDVTLAQRTNRANAANADLFISLHRNAFTNANANGTEVWVFTRPTAAELGLAGEIMERLAQVGIQSNRGVKMGNYHVLRESRMPAVLVELGFITNAWDNELFDNKLEEYSVAIVKAACAALGIEFREEPKPEPRDVMYRIQVGAFRVRENAENFLRTVRGMGLEAFMIASETPRGE